MNEAPILIEHEEAGGRGAFFVTQGGKRVAELTYSAAEGQAIVSHTWVEPRLRNSGLAPRLVAAVVDWARREQLKIVPVCSYVRAVFDRSPQYADVWSQSFS